jgi:hypothetical protein
MEHGNTAGKASPLALAVAAAGARDLGLVLDARALGRVAAQWERLQALVRELDSLPLDLHDQPAPSFVPGARPAP